MLYRILFTLIITLLIFISISNGAEIETWIEKAGDISLAEANNLCAEIFQQGEPAIIGICGYIKPQGDDKNARLLVRMLVNYASTQPIDAQNMLAKAYATALRKIQDKQIKAFLISELQILGNPLAVDAITEYLGDTDLCDYAIRALETINNDVSFQQLAEQLPHSEGRCQLGIIQAFAGMGRTEIIPSLEALLPSASSEVRQSILITLSQLEPNSQKFYEQIKSDLNSSESRTRMQAYSLLFSQIERTIRQNGITQQQKEMLEKILLQAKQENNSWVQCAVLRMFTYAPPKDVLDLFAREIYNPNRDVRGVALRHLAYLNSKESKNILKEALLRSSGDELYQVLDAVSQCPDDFFLPAVVPVLKHSDVQMRIKAIQTLVRLDKSKSIDNLVKHLANAQERSELTALQQALLQTEPKETESHIGSMLKKLKGEQLVTALNILSERQATKYFKFAWKQTRNKDMKIQQSAFDALGNMGTKKEVNILLKEVMNPKNSQKEEYADAIVQILKREEDQDRCKPLIAIIEKSKPEQYPTLLSILAKVGDKMGEDFVFSWLNLPHQKEENKTKIENALSALALWENVEPSEKILTFFRANPNHPYKNEAWKVFIRFLSLNGLAIDEKIWLCQQGIELVPENANDMFNILGGIHTTEAFIAVAPYTKNPAFSEVANKTLLRIALPDKNNENGLVGKDLIPYLENILNAITDEAVKETINKHIERCRKATNILPVTYEDDNQFVPIFNGKDLTGWSGYTKGFSAKYGKLVCLPTCHLNLFSEKQYANFILRFEFKLTPGANNGIGLRVPYMKHAAYDGMEIQILDDTAPESRGLKPYQYHGAIYGVLPPDKPAPLKKCGEWNQEEIVLQGMDISVRVNGVEILKANLNELASKPTPDEKDHLGLRNTSGHIALLGHGSQVEFRNIRIREIK
ncbi:MAG TPA: DUF1080 domain-containing protein [Candidatus Hydrogenedens sp.]|nr:DUF1080 domain-containing protein [Candidatus Hydrogenedens sp.]HPP59194.1 DUF1080 domain-containing protein [Candidatus Hydrogenedens sp.]